MNIVLFFVRSMPELVQKHNGFTLIETMVVIAIIAIIATFSVSSFKNWIDESNARAAFSKIRSTLVLARMESIKHGGWIRLCGSSNGDICDGTIVNGWILYHDENSNDTFDSTDTAIHKESINADRLTVSLENPEGQSLNSIGFNYKGYTFQDAVVRTSAGDHTVEIDISRIGRISSHQ